MAPKSKKTNFEEVDVDEKEIQSMETSENDRFSIEEEFNKAQVRLEKQKFHLRWATGVGALVAVMVLIGLEYLILQHMKDLPDDIAGDLVLLAVSPIFAITAIVVSVSIGVFGIKLGNFSKTAQVIGNASGGLG